MRRVAVLGARVVEREALEGVDDVIVLDPSPDALLGALERLADPRCSFLLGGLPTLPLPDDWVDDVLGDGEDPELDRIRR